MATLIIDTRYTEGKKLLENLKNKQFVKIIEQGSQAEDEWLALEIEKSKETGEADQQTMLKRFNVK